MKRIFSAATGINNTDDPVRLKFDSGISDLQYAVDIILDRTGRPTIRNGYSEIDAGDYHSLWHDYGDCFVAKGTALYRVNDDFTTTGIRSGLSGNRIVYAQHGTKTYYSDGTYNGVIESASSSAWPSHEYVGPETSEEFSSVPLASHICINRGVMYVVPTDEPDVLYASMPGQFGLYSLARDHWKFDSKIIMIKSVEQGIYLSTLNNTFFLRTTGERPSFEYKLSYPALEGSECTELVDGGKLNMELNGLVALWGSSKGACVGTPDGMVINLTERKLLHNFEWTGATVIDDEQLLYSSSCGKTIAVNIEGFRGATQFSNFTFNSFANFNGERLAANSSGFYQLGGSTDDGTTITGYFAPLLTDFGNAHPKRLRYLYFGYESDGDLTITVYADEQAGRSYTLSATKSGQQRVRLPIGRDGSGRYWTIKITGASEYSIDTIDVEYISRNHGIIKG